jgi:type II secretory pathway pseudopilin PulG
MPASFSYAPHSCLRKQRGAALMVMLVILILGAAALLLNSLSSSKLRLERDKVTTDALVQAKEALIGYAAKANTPGQLPCPENTLSIGSPNEGQSAGSCSLPAIGRLPWRTLGLGPTNDSNGEKLWYVISPGFRTSPINSDTLAQLTVDGIPNSAVAIIFSAGPPINGQVRPIPTASIPPVVSQYLELSNNDLNNTFISSGPADTFNDRLLVVTHNDLFSVVEKRVAKEVTNALNDYYVVNHYYPRPANFNDNGCLGYPDITAGCNSDATINKGRIPATPSITWDSLSILRGTTTFGGNWFQSNAWREVIFYAVATNCTDGTNNCPGGNLTLNNPAGLTLSNQKVVVIATGSALSTTTPAQARSSTALKTSISNYLEEENLSPLDDFYTKSAAMPFNDIAISIP